MDDSKTYQTKNKDNLTQKWKKTSPKMEEDLTKNGRRPQPIEKDLTQKMNTT